MARHASRSLAAVAGCAAGALAALPAGLCTGACGSCGACVGLVGVVLAGGVVRLGVALASRAQAGELSLRRRRQRRTERSS